MFSAEVTSGTNVSIQLGTQIIPISPSTQYSFSIWYYLHGTYMQAYPYVRTSVNNDSLGQFAYNGDTNGGNWPKDQWLYLTATVTTQSNETGIYMSSYIGTAVGDKVYYFCYQIEQKPHCTPLVLGTRGVTVETNGGWKNLVGDNNGDLTSMTYDSNAVMYCDGVSGHASLTDTISLRQNTNWTISGWVKMVSYLGYDKILVGKTGWHGGITYTNVIYFNIFSTVGDNYAIGGISPTFGKWYYYVATYASNGDMKFYVDGILNSSGSFNNTKTMNYEGNNTLFIGGSGASGNGYHCNCYVDNVQIYNKTLSAAEVLQNYNALKGRFGL